MASDPITSQQINGKTMGTVTNFTLGGSKITADSDCSNEIKRLLLLGRKVMTNLNSILKSRDIPLPTNFGSLKKQEFQKHIYFCFTDYAKAFDCVDHNKLGEILERSTSRLYVVTLFI